MLECNAMSTTNVVGGKKLSFPSLMNDKWMDLFIGSFWREIGIYHKSLDLNNYIKVEGQHSPVAIDSRNSPTI